MDNLGEFVYVLVFIGFVIIAIIRRVREGNDVEKRNLEGKDWTVEDLPEDTRRMLFGDPAPPTAKPAQPKRSPDIFQEPRKALGELRRQVAQEVARRVEPPTAMPRQGAPRTAPVPPPMPQQGPARQAQPLQPEFRQPPIVQHQPAPPRHAAPPQPPRMVAPQAQGHQQRPVQQQRPAQAPMQKRKKQMPQAPSSRDVDEGPHSPFPMSSQRKVRTIPHRRWLADKKELRKAIILSEILGPPKALR